MLTSLIVIDDFYPDGDEARRIALSFDYPERAGGGNYPGRNSRQRLLPASLDEVVSKITDEPLEGASQHPTGEPLSHGHFRITLGHEESRFAVHIDANVTWSGIAYLNLPEQCQGGTAFFRHKGLNDDRFPLEMAPLRKLGFASVDDALRHITLNESNEPENWEHQMTVPMRFNRLILFRPWLWHSPAAPFGTDLESGRLIQTLFFRRKAAD